ncbi:MAG: HTH domain-containing protein [candidate division WOR-3 bacterium]|nr:HTH domain-containing protein [candidate division WOR-3 bacterium]
MEYLHRNKIIYRRDPINDVPTEEFPWGWYYENGTYEYYNLFSFKDKITSYVSLQWHLHTILYLNPELTEEKLREIALVFSNPRNGYCLYPLHADRVMETVDDVLKMDLEIPPANRKRKVIFKDYCGLTAHEKLSISGKMIGRSKSITESDLYEMMLLLHDRGEIITIKSLAQELETSTRTIYRTLSNQLNDEKTRLNYALRNEKLQSEELH